MLILSVKGDGIRRFEAAVEVLGEAKARNAYRRALNDAGRDTRKPTYDALAQQTGLRKMTTRKALHPIKAMGGNLEFKFVGKGGFIALKYFKARETRAGVSAAPRGQREVFATSFMKGGLFPDRKELALNNQVFYPYPGGWGRKFFKARSDVRIPDEMVQGTTAATFERVGLTKLDAKLARHIKLVTDGVLG